MKKGIFNAILTAIVFVTLEPVSKLIAGDVDPFLVTFWRFFIGALVLLPFAIVTIKKKKLRITPRDAALMTLLGILFVCISMTTLQIAVKVADTPSLIAIIFSSNSVFTIIFSMLILKNKMTWQKWCTVILCTIGVLICVDFTSGTNLQSILLALIAAMSFSIYSVLGQKFGMKLGGLVQLTFAFITGSIILLGILLFTGVGIMVPFTVKNISILCYLGIVVTGIGYWSYFKGIELGGSIMGSLAFFIKPILTPFATFIINGVVPDIKVFAAVLFIVAGSYLAVYKKRTGDKS